MHSVTPRLARQTISRLAAAACLTLLLMLAAALARAQCSITGPDVVCNGATVTLCGSTEGIYQYYWSGPNGFSVVSMNACVDVTTPGTYSLQLFDIETGFWYGPCTHTLSSASTTSCSISGPTSACAGTAVDLCGPSGNLSYRWSGPNGFSDSSMCVHLTVAGTYQLDLTDLTTGCAIAPCQQSVAFTSCQDPISCPRTARFWADQCSSAESLIALSGEQMATIAACVDQRCESFAWSNTLDGFCSTLGRSPHATVRDRAKRQMAALAANLCAGSLALATSTGASIGLNPSTPFQSTTIGAWTEGADHEMAGLESASLRDKNVRAAYRDIIRGAWNINHGHGIGPVCGDHLQTTRQGAGGGVPIGANGPQMADAEDAAEPLEVELADDAPELVIQRIAPNPAASRATITYELVATSSEPVRLAIYDLAGRRLRELVVALQAPGLYEIDWDGRDSSGQPVPGGVYFVRGHAGSQPVQSRVTMIR